MSFKKKFFQDPFLINTVLLVFLVMAISIQVLVVLEWVFSFIPIKPSPLIATLSLRQQSLVVLKRDMSFYHFFIAVAVFLQAAGMFILKPHLTKRPFVRELLVFTLAEYGWTFLVIFSVFKMFVYDFAGWTKAFFYSSLAIGVLSKIFWKEIRSLTRAAMRYWNDHGQDVKVRRFADLFFVWLVFLIIYIPDIQGLLAKMFMTDHFHHFDTMIMSPAWAHLKGEVLDIDCFTHYAIGLPIVIGRLASILGGFNYPSVVHLLCLGTVVYYIGVYALARYWIKSVVMAMAMVILLIKWQMFHPGVAPIIFNYPSASIWRYPLDIVVLFLLLSHQRSRKGWLLIAAAVLCGFSSFYMIDTGVYLSVAYVFYIMADLLMDIQDASLKEIRAMVLRAAGLILLVPATTLGSLWLTQGNYLFTELFWNNLSERTSLFLMGDGDLPMYKSLIEGKFLESWMGFFIPWAYTFVLVVTSTLLFLRKISREHLFVATLTVYGLGLYHYYVVRSADTSYYVVVLPFVFMAGFILNLLIGQGPYRRYFLAATLGITLFSLVTNQYFLNYPNMLQFSRDPYTRPFVTIKLDDNLSFFNHNDLVLSPALKLSANSLGESDEELMTEKDFNDDSQLKDYYHREFDFSKDASLIDRLTDKSQGAVLISSFETRILMQADRRPFFYYFPLIDSRPMHMRIFPFTSLWTNARVSKTIQEFQENKPPFIFMEKILLAQSVPASYEYLNPDMLVMLEYIHRYYVPYAEGHYLIAMKRKGGE